jgi:hypothetical protein
MRMIVHLDLIVSLDSFEEGSAQPADKEGGGLQVLAPLPEWKDASSSLVLDCFDSESPTLILLLSMSYFPLCIIILLII